MQRVLRFEEAYKAESIIDNMALQKGVLKDYLEKRRTAAFESYVNFNLCSFDFYDVDSTLVDTARVLLYLDREDLIIFCEDERTCQSMEKLLPEQESDKEMALRGFFTALLENDMDFIDSWEDSITEAEDQALAGDTKDYLGKIIEYRKELLRLKRYYTQLQVIFDGLLDNENGLLSGEALRHLGIIDSRIDRCYRGVLNLRDYVTQMREAYQSQIDIEQNSLMKFFTLITAIFLPLTLMVGWYGMNFRNMPELASRYGYPVFIVVSILVSIFLIRYFKKKKWL